MPAPLGTNVEIIVQGSVATSGGGGKTFINTFHMQHVGGAGPAPTKAQIDTMFVTNIWSVIFPNLTTDWVGQQITVRFMDDSTDVPAVTSVPASGTDALPRLDSFSAAVLLLRTGLRGKSYRGSKHFGPLASSTVVKDELTNAAVTAWNAVLTAIQSVWNSGTLWNYQCAIFSKTKSPSLVNPTNLVVTPLDGAGRTNKTVGTMKRRKEKTNF